MDCHFIWNSFLSSLRGIHGFQAPKAIDKETEAQALIGDEVVQGIDDINQAQKEIVQDLKEAKKEVVKDLKDARKEVVQDIKDFRQDIKTDIKSVGDKLKK